MGHPVEFLTAEEFKNCFTAATSLSVIIESKSLENKISTFESSIGKNLQIKG